jgi:Carboxypeptidase regulatory-like domain/TonB dependent receptor-like, beta-barrel
MQRKFWSSIGRRTSVTLVQIPAIAILSCGLAFGQSFTAGVVGRVEDATGALVPGASITITDIDRGTSQTAVADEAGRFSITALPPGQYVLAVESPGFKKFASGSFTLTVQQQATVNARLEVGELSETLEVTAAAAMVNTTIANLGQVIDNLTIVSLPNLGRNPMAFTYLTPGVVGSGGRPGDSNTNFVANGSRNSTSDVLLDGVTVVTVEQNSGITDLKYSPAVDAVQEFKVQTNFFSAEFGQTGGAVVNMITKSGTNNFDGTGYYFLRHSSLNANNWFSNRAGQTLPYSRRDQIGGVFGGPLVRNKTFFFVTYEYTGAKSPLTSLRTVPTLLQRQGDFSQTRNAAGQLMTIYNPFDTFINAQGNVERRPFPGNVIPASMMDPIALRALAYFPLPNQPGAPNTETNNWFAQGINESVSRQMNFKVDQNFSTLSRLSARYSYSPSTGTPPNLFGDLAPAFPLNNGPSFGSSHASVAEFTRTQGSTGLWNVRYGLTYSTYVRDPLEYFRLTDLGLPQYMLDQADYAVFPRFNPDGYGPIGTEGWLKMDRQEGVHHFSGSYTKMMGGHSLKAGTEYRFNFLDYAQPGYPAGGFNFGRGVTCRDRFACPGNEGNGLAAMLIGWPTGGDFHIDPKVFTRSAYWGFYAHDDWRVTQNLTLNLGLRYDFDVPRWETGNRMSYWDLDAQSPIVVAGYDTHGVFRFVDDSRRSPFDADMNNVQPRLGFAYAVNPKTSVRGGYGLFYTLSRATVFGHTGGGFNVNATPTFTLDSNATRYATLANPYPNGMLLPPGNSLGESTYLGLGAGTILPSNNRNPEYHSWNLSVQREIGWSSMFEANYTGSRGTHLFVPITTLTPLDQQYWSMGRTALTAAVPNPFYGLITDPKATNLNGPTVQQYRLLRPMPHFDGANVGTAEPAIGDSSYHALQFKFDKRFSDGLSLMAHYTWAKMIDNASHASGNVSWLGGSSSIQNIFDLDSERSLSTHDVAHRIVLTGVWQLPFGRDRQWGSNWNRLADGLLGGWDVSGLFSRQSGMPLAVTLSGGNIWNGTQRPNLIGDPSTSGPITSRLNNYFNADAFSRPPTDVPGTAPRTLNYRGPAVQIFDAAVMKNIAVGAGRRVEVRIEAQNVLNYPIFSDPTGTATEFGSTAFGQITSTKVGPRQMMLGFKYHF